MVGPDILGVTLRGSLIRTATLGSNSVEQFILQHGTVTATAVPEGLKARVLAPLRNGDNLLRLASACQPACLLALLFVLNPPHLHLLALPLPLPGRGQFPSAGSKAIGRCL
jgi:hypothetical protein